MKILCISIVNLNSLRGAHSLDFTEEPLAGAGLFAITGPTGAGKSTILDAVTLALYGRAARYGKTPNPEEMMSSHTAHCRAEVEFEVSAGRYRAEWELRRAHNKAEGKIQPPQRAVYDAAGVPLTQQLRDSETLIESLIGLNYERFLRSVLLAQGDFARFLKAPPDERADLLEKLTGTGIYSRLGQQVHLERNGRKDALALREDRLARTPVLSAEERALLQESMEETTQRLESLRVELEEGEEIQRRITALKESLKREETARARIRDLEKQTEESASALEALRLHRLALPYVEAVTRLDSAERELLLARERENAATGAADTAAVAGKEALQTLRHALCRALTTAQNRESEARTTLTRAQTDAAGIREWLDGNARDEALTESVADITVALEQHAQGRTDLKERREEWGNLTGAPLPQSVLENFRHLETALTSHMEDARLRHGESRRSLEVAREEVEARQDHLHKAQLIASFEEQRHALVEGQPCPLCGAETHPWAAGAAPGLTTEELQGRLRDARARYDALLAGVRSEEIALSRLATLGETMTTLALRVDQLQETLREKLAPLELTPPAPGEEHPLRDALKRRVDQWRQQREKLQLARETQATAEHLMEDARRDVAALREKAEALPPEVPAPDALSPVAPAPQGELDFEQPAAGTAALPAALPSAAAPTLTVTAAEEAHALALQQERTARAQAADRATDAREAQSRLEEMRQSIGAVIDESPFETLQELRAALLSAEDARNIDALERDLHRMGAEAQTLLRQAEEEIRELELRNTPRGDDAAPFLQRLTEQRNEREELREKRVALAENLNRDDTARAQREQLERELQEARKELELWHRLHHLIGSHDGSKFKRYAQSVSLDILVRHANGHLRRLTERYLIRRDETEPVSLQLTIEDLHQAGVRRPMESLSGGESFLASLALALGLADLAGRLVRIDSLFIDEGFGSLDPETLDVAISALESLRQNHKTVGVISHVALLKERIGTRVAVERDSNGNGRFLVQAG